MCWAALPGDYLQVTLVHLLLPVEHRLGNSARSGRRSPDPAIRDGEPVVHVETLTSALNVREPIGGSRERLEVLQLGLPTDDRVVEVNEMLLAQTLRAGL